jgi:hypothetical protein
VGNASLNAHGVGAAQYCGGRIREARCRDVCATSCGRSRGR